jgi:demethylmenaquinone methyltransferase/2-methoxy-6-polyprenyl-1,4-benzoquinol methylase
LKEPKAKVFADSVYAPLNDEVHCALVDLFNMRWPDVSAELSSEDLAEFQRLCLPNSTGFILNLPDYYAFFTYTMFWGKK